MSELTHFDSEGNAIMVDVSEKPVTTRIAVAIGKIYVCQEILSAFSATRLPRAMCSAWRVWLASWPQSAPASSFPCATRCH